MNKQELIERIEGLKNIFGNKCEYVKIDFMIKLVSELDEPEAGQTDEATSYDKKILARLRELPLHDREVWLKAIMGEFEKDFSRAKWCEGYEQGKFDGEWVGNQLKDADKIRQELNKPMIPQFVADWIEECKAKGKNLLRALLYTPEKVNSWVDDPDNQEIFALAWMFGYTVENEKRYLVKMKDIEINFNFLNRHRSENYWIFSSKDKNTLYQTHHTRKELEEANFGWVFDCPGIEIEEVE